MTTIEIRLRLVLPKGVRFGPGKAELLDLIHAEGSISAAGRRMDMSYRRAWALVEEMNAAFKSPLVASSRGGAAGGGAHLTELGHDVVARYRRMQDTLATGCSADLAALEATLANMHDGE